MDFKHELARDAKIWPTAGVKGKVRRVLVVITALELDKESKDFKTKKFSLLSTAAKEWVSEHQTEADDYMIISRPKVWTVD